MTQAAAQFVGDIPRNYDECLGPILFEDYAADIARRAAETGASDVLELAAGTGIVSQKLAQNLPNARVTVTDLNAPMLEIAKGRLGADAIVQQADAMTLPFGDASYDLIVCQFGVMFFPDKVASFREARRVLRAGGRYLFNVWAPMAVNPFAQIAYDVCLKFFPKDPPQFYRTPFGYGDSAAVRADLSNAGFSDVGHDAVKLNKEVRDWAKFAHGLVFGNPLSAEIAARGGVTAEEVETAALEALRKRFGPETARMPLEAIVFEARKS